MSLLSQMKSWRYLTHVLKDVLQGVTEPPSILPNHLQSPRCYRFLSNSAALCEPTIMYLHVTGTATCWCPHFWVWHFTILQSQDIKLRLLLSFFSWLPINFILKSQLRAPVVCFVSHTHTRYKWGENFNQKGPLAQTFCEVS